MKTQPKPDTYVTLRSSNTDIMSGIDKQPITVEVDGGSSVFKFYSSGVITSTDCGTSETHAVVAVGYGTENGENYFLVRNSWGTGWGE